MPNIERPNMDFLWANEGAILEPTDAKKVQGWTAEIPPHQWENWVQNRQDLVLAYIYQKGIPEWDESTEYYKDVSFTQHEGVLYKALEDNEGSEPSSVNTDWLELVFYSDDIEQALHTYADNAANQALQDANQYTDAGLSTKADLTDPRFSDAREWTAATVSQAEAEAGTATTRRAWTAQRVRQAITAWWNQLGTSFGRGFVALADAAAGRTKLGLGTAAIKNVTTNALDTTADRVLRVGDGGLLAGQPPNVTDEFLDGSMPGGIYRVAGPQSPDRPFGFGSMISIPYSEAADRQAQIAISADGRLLYRATQHSRSWSEVLTSGSLNLGTASSKDVGTSPGDVMEVGAFGLGFVGDLPRILDLDSPFTPNGLYSAHSSVTPGTFPAGFIAGSVRVEAYRNGGPGDEYVKQTFNVAEKGVNRSFSRSYDGITSSWTDWQSEGSQELGDGQTWQDVSSSRTVGTTYTNTTGRTISVMLSANVNSMSEFFVDGTSIFVQDGSPGLSIITAIIPNGSTYSLGARTNTDGWKWLELR